MPNSANRGANWGFRKTIWLFFSETVIFLVFWIPLIGGSPTENGGEGIVIA